MPYIYLAECYDEFYPLNEAVENLALLETPLIASREESYFYQEIERIKSAAKRDILVFGDYIHYYINRHVRRAGKLVIRLKEIDEQLRKSIIMSEDQKMLSSLFNILICLLTDLMEFFSNLGNQAAK